MMTALVRGTGRAVLTLLMVVSFVHLLTSLLPGDAAAATAGADSAAAAELRRDLGLDRPVLLRLLDWWAHAVRGDLGESWLGGAAVTGTIAPRLMASAAIAVPAWALAMLTGVALALLLGRWRGRSGERVGSGAVAVIAGIPEAVTVVLLVLVLAVALRIVPAVSLLTPGLPPWSRPELLVLPILALAVPAGAFCARNLRGPAEEAWQRRIATSARRRGLSGMRIALVHVFPAMLPAVIQTAAITASGILAAGAVAESLLAYPGAGQLLASSLAGRDIPVVQGLALVLCAVAIAALWTADLLAELLARRVAG